MTPATKPSPNISSLTGAPTPAEVAAAEATATDVLVIPRWVVYCQAGLLALSAFLFFIFGLMVGNWTAPRGGADAARMDCQVYGSVSYRDDGDLRADEGAVVFLLPALGKPDQRSPGSLVNPDSFAALDNPAIDRIHELGGAVVRADENGDFNVVVDADPQRGIEYFVWVVSNHKRGVDTAPMTKEQFAVTGTFFLPVEDVVEDRSFFWMKVKVTDQRLDLPVIEL